jgi:FAD/FMN-containing dehydrogenase
VVLAPGELVEIGGTARKDVGGYDLRALLIGSEGTLGVVTGAWLRLLPAPEAELPVVALYPDLARGCAAVASVLGSGVVPAALEFLDPAAVAVGAARFPGGERAAGMMVIGEADGARAEAERVRSELLEAMSPGASRVYAPDSRAEIAVLWSWRSGVSLAVAAQRGGKVSEDIVVPVERLGEAIERALEIGARHALAACSWGMPATGTCMRR